MMINRKSVYSDSTKTIDDLLMNISLRTECFNIFNWGNDLKRGNFYEIETKETNDEIILLLQELGLITEINWDWLKKQSPKNIYKEGGYRTIKFTFEADKIIDLIDRANGKNSVIRKQALEFIARHIGDLASGNNLVKFLQNLGIPNSLIVYPNTKWRMIYDVLLYYASYPEIEDRKMLFKIIEEVSHPLMHGGDKNLTKETTDKFNSFLEYDNFVIRDGLLWKVWEDPSGCPIWYDKDGNSNETPVYLILPKKIDKIYLYWNELIKLTKFYFSNKDNQGDEINSIYFEIIANIEDVLSGDGCGILKEQYKRPFRNMVGCEFEIQKQGLTPDSLFVKLYDFLGEITEHSLPNKNNIEKMKNDNSVFFIKLKQYVEKHIPINELKPTAQEQMVARTEITKMPILEIKGLQEKVVFQKSKKRKISIHNFPPNLTWEEITINFLNGQEVIIKTRDKITQTTFEEMGFMDEKRKLPNKQWELLLELAKRNGEMSWQNNKNLSQKDIDAVKKRKQILSDTLKTYFQISDDPFSDYNKEKIYKIRINLVAEDNNKASNQSDDDEDDLGLKRYFEEEAPQIND